MVERKITTADGRTLTAVGMGDLHIELPNGSVKTKTVFKNTIHAPEMAFTLTSTSGKRGLVLEKPRLLQVSLETLKTSKIIKDQKSPGCSQS